MTYFGEILENINLSEFLRQHPPTDVKPADNQTIEKYRELLPECLLELWKHSGFGKYGDGLIEIINPDDYKQLLYGWLMYDEEDLSRLPIAISAFGALLYYRKLGSEDEDIAFIDPHYCESGVVCWSLESFFNESLCNSDYLEVLQKQGLFKEALADFGKLTPGEIFYFAPAIPLGGAEELKHIRKGSAVVQLDILLQLALS